MTVELDDLSGPAETAKGAPAPEERRRSVGGQAGEESERRSANSSRARTPPELRLSGAQKKMLAHKLDNKFEAVREDLDLAHHHHAEKPLSVLTAAISGIINYLLMFGLCAAYGLIMFSDEHNERHSPLGVKMNLGTAMISGLMVASFSKIKVAIGGPDLNPVVLLGTFVDSIQASIASQLNLELPSGGRRLGASYESDGQLFCSGAHLESHLAECEAFHNELRATAIFATAVSSLVFVVLFLLFGTFKFTRYVSYIPTSIVEAFLSCIGYKVFLYALKFCHYDPFQFVPAACIGVPLYFMKAYHIGHPGIVMPAGILLPLGIFYAVVYGIMKSDIDSLREEKLMFPFMENVGFWHVWTDSVGKPQHINLKAWLTTLPDLAIMIIVVLLDCLLKIIGTESKLHLKVDRDYEVRLHGLGNIATMLTGSSVGYMQLKFNVINAGVLRNLEDRRGAMFYAVLCGACYFGTIAPINYMPRFFVGSLLFFAGAGFVCENLWGSRRYLQPVEWLEVLLILAVFILTGQLLLAVITGGCICGISFIVKYSRVPTIDGKPMRGADLKIVERRGPLLLRNIRHITKSWLLVVRLKGFVFFASAQSLTAHVLSIISSEEERNVSSYRRLRVVVFDCKALDGVDASASKALASFVRDAKEHKVSVLWSGLSKPFHEEFKTRGIILTEKSVLADLEEAVMSVEDLARRYLHTIEKRWMSLHNAFMDNMIKAQNHYKFEPFMQIFLSTTGRIGCPWQYCSKKTMEGHHTVLWTPGEMNGVLYLVHSGAVGLFETLPEDDEQWGSPVAVYRHGWFLNRETIMRVPAKFYGVALEDGELLCWTQERWWGMACERPLMMSEILKSVMKQQAGDCDAMEISHSPTQANWQEAADVDEAAWDGLQRATSFLRQDSEQSSDAHAPVHHVRLVGDEFADLPEWLATRLQSLESASVLSGLKFYSPPPEGDTAKLPSLPALLKRDLEIAFNTYADQTGRIESGTVSDALKFAGVFEVSPSVQDDDHASYSQEEFMGIGHKALMAPLCQRDLQTIETYFRKADVDGDGTLNRHELMCFLQRTVSKHLYLEEVDGIACAWGRSEHGEISSTVHLDLQSIYSVMSLFIRKHEHCWRMLQGFLEILGTETIKETDVLTVEHLTKAKNATISREQAEEMIWSANWRQAHDGPEAQRFLPWTEFVSAIYVCIMRPGGPLPPTPQIQQSTHGAETSGANRPFGQADTDSEPELARLESAWSVHHDAPGSAAARLTNKLVAQDQHNHRPARTSRQISSLLDLSDIKDSLDGEPTSPPGASPKSAQTQPMASTTRGSAFRKQVAAMLEDPGGTALGRFMRICGYLVIVASVLETILEPFLAGSHKEQSPTEKELWFDLELLVTFVFTIEIILRLTLAKEGVVKCLMKFRAWCLILATLPLYLELILGLVIDQSSVAAYRAVNLLRLARLARLSRLARNQPVMEATVVSLVVIWGIFKKHGFDERLAHASSAWNDDKPLPFS